MKNLSNYGKFTNKTTFHFTGSEDENGSMPEGIREYSHIITKLSADYGAIKVIPDWLSEFDKLSEIKIRAYKIENLEALLNLKNLTGLALSGVTNTYEEISVLIPKLTSLHLEDVGTKDLSFISQGAKLKEVTLDNGNANFDYILDLPELHSLNIKVDGPDGFLPEINELKKLKSLEINSSINKKFSKEVFNEFNKKAAEVISKCQSLYYLSLNGNIGKYVDYALLNDLLDLRFISGTMNYIPDDVLRLPSLLSLIINDCELKEIPYNIDNLKKLERLILVSCEITHIPKQVMSLMNLDTLNLSDNQITDIPIGIASMQSLRDFAYSKNPLNKECMFYDNSLLGVFKQIKQRERDEINIGIIQIPEALRSAVQEYLIYFDEYYEEISGNKIGFKVSKHEQGLKIEVELVNDLDIINVQQALARYTQYLLDKKFDIENDINVDKLVKDLQILKLTLETKSNHFDQQMKILNLRHQITNDENTYLRQIVTQFASKENVFVINQQTSNQNSPQLLSTNTITVNNEIPTNEFREIAELLKAVLGANQELEIAVDELEESAGTGKRSLVGSALSKVANIITNTIDKAHLLLVDAPEVVEKLKATIVIAKTAAINGHYTEVAKLLNNILHMF